MSKQIEINKKWQDALQQAAKEGWKEEALASRAQQIYDDNGYRDCNVCGKSFNLFDGYGLLDLEEILDCTEERQHQWQKENPNIDLTGYFCSNCAGDTIEDIEGNE